MLIENIKINVRKVATNLKQNLNNKKDDIPALPDDLPFLPIHNIHISNNNLIQLGLNQTTLHSSIYTNSLISIYSGYTWERESSRSRSACACFSWNS